MERSVNVANDVGKTNDTITESVDTQSLLTISSLRMDVRGLRKENERLRLQLEELRAVLNIASITKIFNELAPISIHHRYFMGKYRQKILFEVVTRYNSCMYVETTNIIDYKVVANIIRRIGNECNEGILKTSSGDTICFGGG